MLIEGHSSSHLTHSLLNHQDLIGDQSSKLCFWAEYKCSYWKSINKPRWILQGDCRIGKCSSSPLAPQTKREGWWRKHFKRPSCSQAWQHLPGILAIPESTFGANPDQVSLTFLRLLTSHRITVLSMRFFLLFFFFFFSFPFFRWIFISKLGLASSCV